MNRLDAIFARASGKRPLVIPYICAGDPDLATSRAVVRALADAGAEIVEVGFPFSDPVGDGPTIARAAERALRAGVTLSQTLDLCGSTLDGPAIVLFGYLNPIARYGVDRFARDAGAAGVSGVIVADLPYEERRLLAPALHARGIALILLVTPSTPLERAIEIAEASDAFVYVVSRLGVTGAALEPNLTALKRRILGLRGHTTRPVAVGFGLHDAQQIAGIAAHADGIVVGSALVDALMGSVGVDAATRAQTFIRPLIEATLLRGSEPAPGCPSVV